MVDINPKNVLKILESCSQGQRWWRKQENNFAPLAAEYILSTTEAAAYTSFMEYPQMYAETRKLAISDQGMAIIGKLWTE